MRVLNSIVRRLFAYPALLIGLLLRIAGNLFIDFALWTLDIKIVYSDFKKVSLIYTEGSLVTPCLVGTSVLGRRFAYMAARRLPLFLR